MAEAVQKGTAADGNGNVLFLETLADPAAPTAAELAAGVPITYGITPDGFQHQTTINTITTGRYTLAQALELEGTITDTLEITYVYRRGTTPTPVEVAIGSKGVTGYIVHALGYPNDHTFVSGDKINAIIPIETGTPRDNAPTANSELTKTVKCNVTGTVEREVSVAAGA